MAADIIKTRRLILRPVRNGDPDVLHETVFSDNKVMSLAFLGRTFSMPESRKFVADHFDHDGNGKQPGVLVVADTGEIAGFAGLLQCSVLGEADYEIGFVLARPHWGKGYATEIGTAQIEHGLETIGCSRLLAQVSPANTASISVLRKIGMQFHSTIDTENRGRRDIYVTPA